MILDVAGSNPVSHPWAPVGGAFLFLRPIRQQDFPEPSKSHGVLLSGKAIHQSAAEFRDRQSLAVGWIDSPSVTAVLVVLGDLGVLKTW